MPMTMVEKTRENRLRRHARRLGLRLEKSRVRLHHLNDRGRWQIVDDHNTVVEGDRWDLTLDRVEELLVGIEQRQRAELAS